MMEDETESETEILISKPPPKPSRPKIWVRNLDRNILHSIFETESAAFYVPHWYLQKYKGSRHLHLPFRTKNRKGDKKSEGTVTQQRDAAA